MFSVVRGPAEPVGTRHLLVSLPGLLTTPVQSQQLASDSQLGHIIMASELVGQALGYMWGLAAESLEKLLYVICKASCLFTYTDVGFLVQCHLLNI